MTRKGGTGDEAGLSPNGSEGNGLPVDRLARPSSLAAIHEKTATRRTLVRNGGYPQMTITVSCQ